MKENQFVLEHINDLKLKEKVKLLQMIRDYEQNDYPLSDGQELRKFILDNEFIEDELKEISEEYTRFGNKTYNKINELF